MRLEPGSVFAGYRIVRLLGEGGMGSVYLARHPRLPRTDALKLLSGVHAGNAEFRSRFEREADLVATLRQPNIVSVYDRGVEGGQLWISMQYIDGTDAAELVRSGPRVLTPQRALVIVGDTAKALDYAHRQGVLHRDVKPANILVTAATDDSSGETALLTDFGIARAVHSASGELTLPGYMVGTTAYAAPEVLNGAKADPRADIYALACTLYEMLTGRQPYLRDSVLSLMQAHLTAPLPIPSRERPGLPPALDHVIARGLSKDPDQRYRTCRELYDDAARAFGQTPPPIQVLPLPYTGPMPTVSTQPRPRNRALLAGVVAAVAVLVAGITTLVVGLSRSDSSPAATSTTRVATSTSSTPGVSAEPAPTAAAGPVVTSDDGTFTVSLPEGWKEGPLQMLMLLKSMTGGSSMVMSRNPEDVQGADVAASAEIGSKQIVDELGGVIDSGGIETSTVDGEPAAKYTFSVPADANGGEEMRGRQYFVRHNGIEYIITCSGTVSGFNGESRFNDDVADYEYVINSWKWLN